MDSDSRRKIESGKSSLVFCRAHPDPEPSGALVAARLEQLIARADEAAAAQRDGMVRVHAASARKQELRRQMRQVSIPHLAEVARQASREQHQLREIFRFRPAASTFLAFQTAAQSMLAAAQAHSEVLLKYGLSQSVLDEFAHMLDEFAAAITLGNEGRAAHAGATREIGAASREIVRALRLMNGRIRQRFAEDQTVLGSWISASAVRAPRRPITESEAGPPHGGEVRPA